ncbi:RNase H [Shinella sp. SUS2]|uniref:nuclear transport factor 2 family protein n=1 Tax=unclassified Shinella TaxID=2643062 RepID=UPI0006817843|nr:MULTISPECIES: DUF4440 domain-containing protein [unclassified Shinella]KNY16701.1 RNase H [Shinella sp. SUS2]KOC77043.1 RNase H [Shinella sp. GWS1]TAA59054.1 DUF4440 domain-containing protein [Shinella sp. JR1-6]
MTGPAASIEEIRMLEEALHRPEVRGSRPAVEALLAEGFVEFGSSGTIYHRAEMLDLLSEEADEPSDGTLEASDYALTAIAEGAVLLTYRTCRRAADGSERHVLRASIWKLVGERWQMAFHQGTVVPVSLS